MKKKEGRVRRHAKIPIPNDEMAKPDNFVRNTVAILIAVYIGSVIISGTIIFFYYLFNLQFPRTSAKFINNDTDHNHPNPC
jgi:hypothetical protein